MTNEPCLRTPPTTAQLSQRTLCSKVYNEARLSDIMLVWWPGRVTVVLELGCEQMLRRTREAPDASKREERLPFFGAVVQAHARGHARSDR